MSVISPETKMMGLPYSEEIMIVRQTMWTQSTSVTDGRTEGQKGRARGGEGRGEEEKGEGRGREGGYLT